MAKENKTDELMTPLLGCGEDQIYGQSIDQEIVKNFENIETEKAFYRKAGSINTLATSGAFADGLLIINDVYLYGVPTAAIKIEKPTDVFVGETLRTPSPVLYSEGRENPLLSLTLVFDSNKDSLDKLHRLVSVLRRHPFAFIHNNRIAREIGVEEFETNIFALESGTLRSTPDTVGVLVLDLAFRLFNYKPFSNHHWYSGRLFRSSAPEEDADREEFPPNALDMRGYDQDQHSISIATEEERRNIRQRVAESALEGDAPVMLPSESPAWMMYADKLSSAQHSIGISFYEPSDYVGFSVKEYEYLSPPGAAREGRGNVKHWYNSDNSGLREHVPPWRVDDSAVMETYQEHSTGMLVDPGPAPNVLDKDSLATYRVVGKERSIQIDANTGLWLARMCVGEGGHKASDEKLAALLWAILNRWGFIAKGRSFIRLIRAFSQPVNPRWIPGGDLYAKWYGTKFANEKRASRRMKIISMSWNSIPKRIRHAVNRFRQGTLPPPAIFKTVPKSRMTNWASLKSTPTKFPWGVDVHGDWFFEDTYARKGNWEIIKPKNSQGELQSPHSMDLNEAQKKVKEKRKLLARTQENEENKAVAESSLVKAEIEAREAWIASEANYGRYYYNEDPNLRNIFYTSHRVDVSGDFRSHLNNTTEQDITCSSLSISFGHRIVPMGLVGQPAKTFQFLGAGNRTGQMVFTFSGDRGEESAANLKNIINIARKNAKYFGHLIPDAGSVQVSAISGNTSEQNHILSLLGIEDIVVTNVEQSSIPDSTDTYQLVIEFIAQEFGEESLEKKFVKSLDSKKRIIRGLMEHVIPIKTGENDKVIFHPKADVALYNHGTGRSYKVANNVPSWFASVVAKTAAVCTKINNEDLPPTKWKQSKTTSKTWKEVYDDWGAGDKLRGRVKNISIRETNGKGKTIAPFVPSHIETNIDATSSKSGDTPLSYNDMYSGIFEYDGGENTSNKHGDALRKWTSHMDAIVSEVYKYAKDEVNFKKYFGSVGEDLLDSVTSKLNECYEDLLLPEVPGSEVKLPPEYYVYDDSDEDPLVAEATSKENMEMHLREHVNNEIATITHYMEKAYLGGSYVSKNLPRILENRKVTQHRNFMKEMEFSRSWMNYFAQGTESWEPVAYRLEDPANNVASSGWYKYMQTQMGASTAKEMNLKYMDNLVRLSSYLEDGRHWETGGSNTDRQALVESIYGEAWDKVAFGPNPEYSNTDSSVLGKAQSNSSFASARTKEEEEAITALQEQVGRDGRLHHTTATLDLDNNRTVRGDGVVTVGDLKEEREKASKSNMPSATDAFIKSIPILNIVSSILSPGLAIYNREVDRLKNLMVWRHPIADGLSEEKNAESIAKIGSSVALGNKKNSISMRRAYPTFRIYFIEDDSEDNELWGKTIVRAFDDFYSYSAVQEIRIHRSRKVAADLAIIRMTNVTGRLMKRRFGDRDSDSTNKAGQERQGIFAETEKENPFEKLVMQEGVKVQIRLGYSADPDNLHSAFLGQVVEISPREDGKILEIVLQGYGAELESVPLGQFDNGPEFYSSQQVLSGAIIQDSIINFGRKSKFNRFNPAEMRHAWQGGKGHGFFASLAPSELIEQWANAKMDMQLNKYTFLNFPQDDNIYAPPPEVYTTSYERFWNNACTYRPLNQTPWQIFKEHELRHPGYISLAVPYGHAPRMTMFFGSKIQHYWSRPPTPFEIFMSENSQNEMIKLKKATLSTKNTAELSKKLKELSAKSPKLARAFLSDVLSTTRPSAVAEEIGKEFGRYIPFRNYHYFDDKHHILKNEIRTSVDNTYNQATILFFEDENDLTDNDADDLKQNISSMLNEEAGVFSVKLDENIPEEHLRSYKEGFPGCVTVEMARRYASGLMARHLKDAYKGELVVIGEETLKPYDVCYINDGSIDMTGPIEVESVTQIISRDTGFISIITPDLCVEVNDMFNSSVFDVAAAANSMIYGDIFISPGAAGWSMLGLMAGVKFMSWTQDGDPVGVTPMTFGGKPFLSVSLGPSTSSIFTQIHGKWEQYWDDLEDAWDKLDIGEAMFDVESSIKTSIFGALGTGFNGGLEPTEGG